MATKYPFVADVILVGAV